MQQKKNRKQKHKISYTQYYIMVSDEMIDWLYCFMWLS